MADPPTPLLDAYPTLRTLLLRSVGVPDGRIHEIAAMRRVR